MRSSWKRTDLGGAGVQALNLRLARVLRRRRTAYLLWIAFPAGAHRWYLKEKFGALAYCLLSLAAAIWAAEIFVGAAAFALFDLWWIDRRVSALNKRLRMELSLRPEPRVRTDSSVL